MKNLAHLPIDVIEDKHPVMNHKRGMTRVCWRKRNELHRIGDYYYWDYIKRTVKKFIGKPFADAFAYYCSKVPIYQQHKFLEEFQPLYCSQNHDLRIDENGNLQLTKDSCFKRLIYGKDPKPAIWESPDVEYEPRHKVTGHPKEQFKEIWSHKWQWSKWSKKWFSVRDKFLYYEYKGDSNKTPSPKDIYRARKSDFENVVIKGQVLEFESKQNREFIRLHREAAKRKKQNNRKEAIKRKEMEYSFISQTELQKKKEKELNNQVITRHGFDLVSSFRGKQSA